MRTKFSLPAQNVPILLPDGTMNPTWYEKLKVTFLGMIHLALGFIRLRAKTNVNRA